MSTLRTEAQKSLCLCLLIATLMLLTSLSAAFFAVAENDAAANPQAPLALTVTMSKSAYFVSAKAKATVTVKNTGLETLKDVAVSAFSEKHQLAKGTNSSLLISELKAGKEQSYEFEMVLDRKTSGVSFFERVFLFFAQLFRKFEPMQTFPALDTSTMLTQTASFRHGSASATLKVNALYNVEGGNGDDPIQRPPVTYLDKYAVDILDSGSFTAEMETKTDEAPVQITMYVDGDDRAVEMPIVQNANLPSWLTEIGKLRVILKDLDTAPKGYVAWTGGYVEMEDVQEAAEMIKESGGGDIRQQLQLDKLQYCGAKAGVGYVCETYRVPDENLEYNFYFTQTSDYAGLVRWDVIDLDTNQVSSLTVIHLTKGVADKDVFNVSGIKHDLSELEGWLS